jgi:DNA (cytosine-5)-methyltransferase 1
MENVEGLIKGEAWSYVQKIYKQLHDIGYQVKHWLLKGQHMGVPQTRHRVFFVAVRNDSHFDLEGLDMSFNYEPITYGEIKSGVGRTLRTESKYYYLLSVAEESDKRIADTLERLGEKGSGFSDIYAREGKVLPTIKANMSIYVPETRGMISTQDIIHSQTFPEDYDFGAENVGYICGMSVPPIMIKRIVTRLIESGLFDYISDKKE